MLPAAMRRRPMRAIAIAVALFVLLDSSVLAINLWISHELDNASITINLAGRQRMLSQRMTKAALLTVSAKDGSQLAIAEVELLDAARQFDETLAGFADGSEVTAGDGRRITIAPLEDPVALELLAQARALWLPIMATLRTLGLDGNPDARQHIASELTAHESRLLDLMNRLTSRIETDSLHRTQTLRAIQTGAFLLALANFAVVIALLHARWRAANREGRQAQGIIDQIAAGVCLLDPHDRITGANPAAERILGQNTRSLKGHRLDELLVPENGVWRGMRGEQQAFHVALSHGRLAIDGGEIRLATLLDLSERVDAEARLRQLALHDALTGLPNRRMLEDRMSVALAQTLRARMKVGVALVDLDGFKPINDRLGHAAGDAVLQAVAQRLVACARAGDTVARLGGDEFVCVFSTLDGAGELGALGERMLEALTQPLAIAGETVPLSASIGLALAPDRGNTVQAILAAADQAMYAAKQAGGARIGKAGPAVGA